MGFLKKILRDVCRDPECVSSFRGLSEEELERHMNIRQYGDFVLTDAVSPSYDLEIVPRTGFRLDAYCDPDTAEEVPALMVSLSEEILFAVFMELIDLLGDTVDVVLESSHCWEGDDISYEQDDSYREDIDTPVLKSFLWEFEDLLLNDGYTGIAVFNPEIPAEIRLDEHKLIIIYNWLKWPKEVLEILADHSVPKIPDIEFICEAEHIHSSSDNFQDQFQQLKFRLGTDHEMAEEIDDLF